MIERFIFIADQFTTRSQFWTRRKQYDCKFNLIDVCWKSRFTINQNKQKYFVLKKWIQKKERWSNLRGKCWTSSSPISHVEGLHSTAITTGKLLRVWKVYAAAIAQFDYPSLSLWANVSHLLVSGILFLYS